MLVQDPRAEFPRRASVSFDTCSDSYCESRVVGWLGTKIHHRIEKHTIDIPVLVIEATNDAALPPSLSDGMERFIPNLTRKEVEATHWALWQKPGEANEMIREWLERVEKTKSSL